MSRPACYQTYSDAKEVCRHCHVLTACKAESDQSAAAGNAAPVVATPVCGAVSSDGAFSLALSLYSGQTFRWGRDDDGWWKGITYGTVLYLKQTSDTVEYVSSATRVLTYAGEMEIETFVRWYLRLDEAPKIRVPRQDRYLRKARDAMRGFRFVRQDPWECTISYILSVQAHMNLTKQRIQFLARILGDEVTINGEHYWTFPSIEALAILDEDYYRHQRFGWRSKFLPVSIERIVTTLHDTHGERSDGIDLEGWRAIVDGLLELPNSGVGLKVAKCIDLFSLERLSSVPVDTWVRKFAEDWYGVEGSDSKICAWGEARGGRLAGYWNEYLFVYYRELNAPALDDRVISFAKSDAPSAVLPFERDGRQGGDGG